MIFRKFIFLLFIFSSFLYGNSYKYQMIPGKYHLNLILTDSEESYPVEMIFDVNNHGNIFYGEVNYPTYNCKSNIINFENKKSYLFFSEKMKFGYDTCSSSIFNIIINKVYFFSPSSKKYIKLKIFDGEEYAKVKIKNYKFFSTRYAHFRIKNKIYNINQILNTYNSDILRKYITLVKNKKDLNIAKLKLQKLSKHEKKEFISLRHSVNINQYKRYIEKYPGSKYISDARAKIKQIKVNHLILKYRNKGTSNAFYQAYKLSHDNQDIVNMMKNIGDLKSLDKFVIVDPQLKFLSEVKFKYIQLYRQEDSFDGYYNSYLLSKSLKDLKQAYKRTATNDEKKKVEIALFQYFGQERFLSVNIINSSESKLHEIGSSGFLTSFHGMGKDYYRVFKIQLDTNQGIHFKYAHYKVTIKVKLNLNYRPHINGKGKDYITKNVIVILNKGNDFIIKKELVFNGVPTHGKYHLASLHLLKIFAGFMGKRNDVSEEIPIELKEYNINYEVVSVDAF